MDKVGWKQMMTTFGFSENIETYEALIAAHAERHRHYHTVEHIKACLAHLDDVKDQMDRPHEVRLALWFHDAIYKPFSETNEKDSADWAVRFLRNNNADPDVIDRVENLILITEHHANPASKDEQFMLDIDLSILGTRPDVYDKFEANVRKEYRRVPKFIFRRKRKEILQSFLDMDQIYKTEIFNARLEPQARDNLVRTIAAL